MSRQDDQIQQLERRLTVVEAALRKLLSDPDSLKRPAAATSSQDSPLAAPSQQATVAAAAVPTGAHRVSTVPARGGPGATRVPVAPAAASGGLSATTALGLGGVAALVLAAAYLVRLAIDTGWLTPMRQISLAAAFGIALVVAGFALKERNRSYAALLPAGGVVVLYMTAYGAHLVHQLIDAQFAIVAVILISLAALALQRVFESTLYLLFAVIGSYSAPILVNAAFGQPQDLVIYFAAFDLVFCAAAWVQRQRSTYLIAAYLAFAIFDMTWRSLGGVTWMWAASFHAFQLLLFMTATILHTRRNEPLTTNEAILHIPPLIFFYIVECSILFRYVPEVAPWLAIASVVPIVAAQVLAGTDGAGRGRPGELIVLSYCALVLFHAVFLELMPNRLFLAAGTAATAALVLTSARKPDLVARGMPIAIALAVMSALSLLWLAVGLELGSQDGWELLLIVNIVVMYAVYFARNGEPVFRVSAGFFLYVGHLLAAVAPIHYDFNRVLVSLVWGVVAIASLLVAIPRGDKVLAQSALLLFAASALKVVLFDLSGSAPLLRIGSLVVLGISLYAGGLLYQRMANREVQS